MGDYNSSGMHTDSDQSLSSPASGVTSGEGGDLITGATGYIADNRMKTDSTTRLGVHVFGAVQAADGSPLSGDAQIEIGGSAYATKSISGSFTVSGRPPDGVEQGEDFATNTYDFRFRPAVTGLDVFTSDVSLSYDAGLIKYGAVAGTVTDYGGDPIEGEAVFGEGAGAKTDANGYYNIAAPGGTTVTLNAIGTSTEETPTGGSTLTVDFQTSRIEIDVVNPDLDPVVGTTVQIGQETYETDQKGRVVLDPAYIVVHDVLVSGETAFQVDVNQQGTLFQQRVGDANKAGVSLVLIDKGTGEPIRALPGKFSTRSLRAKSATNGRLNLYTPDTGDLTLVLAEDKRYKSKQYDLSLSEGQVASARVEMERQPQVTNR